MKLCRFILAPKSPWSTSLCSDTLYGLVLWHVAESEGDKACQDLIEAFTANKPPFVLSSPFKAGFVPMPALPPIGRTAFRELAPKLLPEEKDTELALFKLLQRFKSFRKKGLLPLTDWLAHKDALATASLFKSYLQADKKGAAEGGEDFSKSAFEPHVAIDRSSGSAMDGQLFFIRLNYFNSEAKFHLYARTEEPDWLEKYLKQIGQVGFGHASSTGKGLFEANLDKDFDPKSFETANANASLLLSRCASMDMKDLTAFYRLEEKLGKAGPGYKNPFKRPFLALQEGSILKTPPAPPYVLYKLNSNDKIVQILQPLLLPCRIESQEAE